VSGTSSGVEPARLAVVSNEIEAELACSLLRTEGIECYFKRTDLAAGRADASLSIGGPFEIWVHAADLNFARELLPQ
jgi:hypothetical protein